MNVPLSDEQKKRLERIAIQTGEKPEEILRDVISKGLDHFPDSNGADAQRQALLELVNELRAIPVARQDDGFSGRDHDRGPYDDNA